MTDLQVGASLAGAAASAAAALVARSVRAALGLDTAQAWRWVVHPRSIDLYADPTRWQRRTDPTGALLYISCGGALHHARVALAADGLGVDVTLAPEDSDLIATLTATSEIEVTPEARDLYAATGRGDIERLALTHDAPSPAALRRLAAAAEAEGVRFSVLGPDQVAHLAGATSISKTAQERIGRDHTTTFAVLHGATQTRTDWVRAGQALSAVWLTAVRLGLAVVPSSAVVQLPGSREAMREVLSGHGTPYLALRIGVYAETPFPPAPT